MKIPLLTALRIVTTVESMPTRARVLETIANRRLPVRLTLRIYQLLAESHLSFLATLMLAGFGALAFGVRVRGNGDIIAVARYANEQRQIDFLKTALGAERFRDLRLGYGSLLLPARWIALAVLLPRYLRLVGRLRRRHAFLPACRGAQTLGYYLMFHRLLTSLPCRTAAVASNYSPDGAALALAAQSRGLHTLFCSHAFLSNSGWMPGISFDLAVLSGQAELDEYQGTLLTKSRRILFMGIDGEERPMRLDRLQQDSPVGIFLTGLLDVTGLETIVAALSSRKPSLILIRQHPVTLVHHDLRRLQRRYPNVIITRDTLLLSDIERCNWIISGGSNVHLQILKYGVPSVYVSSLEPLPYDYKHFVRSGIIPAVEDIGRLTPDDIRTFYADPAWQDRFRYFDGGYGMPKDATLRTVRQAAEEVLRG